MFANLMRTIKPASGGGGIETIGSTTIGAATNGGYYAGTISDGGVTYHLIAAPKGSGDPTMSWDSADYDEEYDTGATSVTNGPSNTSILISDPGRFDAAEYCDALNVGGKTDWYLPAKNELAVLYAAKAAFSAAGQAFAAAVYWSSTEYGTHYAWCQHLVSGEQSSGLDKGGSIYVRAVRRLPI